MSKYTRFTDEAYKEAMNRIKNSGAAKNLMGYAPGLAGALMVDGYRTIKKIKSQNKQLRDTLPSLIDNSSMLVSPELSKKFLEVGGTIDELTPQLQNKAIKKALLSAVGGGVVGSGTGYLAKEASGAENKAYRKGLGKAMFNAVKVPLGIIGLGLAGRAALTSSHKALIKSKALRNSKKVLKRDNNLKDIALGKRSIAAKHLADAKPRSAYYRDKALREEAKKNILQLGVPAAGAGVVTHSIINE